MSQETKSVLREVQDEQNHPDGTGQSGDAARVRRARDRRQNAAVTGGPTWRLFLDEEVQGAYAETDTIKLRAKLIQVAVVAWAWVEAIDRRA